MKKIIFLVLSLFMLVGNSFASDNFDVQVQAGLNLSKVNNGYISTTIKPGFNVGVRGEYKFSNEHLFANAAILASLKGYKLGAFGLAATKQNLFYIDIPIHWGYRYDFNDKIGAFADFGPYFGIGVGGKSKSNVMGEDMKFNNFGEEGSYKRFDFGLGFRVGPEFMNRFGVAFAFDWGLIDIQKSEESDYDYDDYDYYYDYDDYGMSKLKNFNFSINFTYRF